MLVSTTRGDNYHTARQKYKKGACIIAYNIKSTQKPKASFSRLLRHSVWKREWESYGRMGRDENAR